MTVMNRLKGAWQGISGKSISMDEMLGMFSVSSGSRAGVAVNEATALQLGTVFGCVRVLSTTAAMLPWSLRYSLAENRSEVAAKHPLHKVLRKRPAGRMTPFTFRYLMMRDALLQGNFYAFKNRINGQVKELVYIDAHRVRVEQLRDFSVRYHVNWPGGGQRVFSADEIFHYFMHTKNGYEGVSLLQYARESIGGGIAMQNHGNELFENGARPDLIIKAGLSNQFKEQKKVFEDQWDASHRGKGKNHRPAFIDSNWSVEDFPIKHRDLQWLEGRKFTRNEICAFFGVPPHLVGDLERATFSNIEHQDLSYLKYGLNPWLEQMEQTANLQLVREDEQDDYFTQIDSSWMLRGDAKAMAEYVTKLTGAPVMERNEGRNKLGMDDLTDLSGLATPLNTGFGDDENTDDKPDSDDEPDQPPETNQHEDKDDDD